MKMKLKCIAIDDEPLALDIIREYCDKTDHLQLIADFTSPVKAISYLRQNRVDIVFLDIQMPELSGFEFLDSLSDKPVIIITTAYEDFALKSYQFDVADYLLKPFSLGHFLKAVDKAYRKLSFKGTNSTSTENDDPGKIFVNTGGKIVGIDLTDISLIKGLSDYIVIVEGQKEHIVRDNLKKAESLLSNRGFIRIHRSYLVSISKIQSADSNSVRIDGVDYPIGKSYKDNLTSALSKLRLG